MTHDPQDKALETLFATARKDTPDLSDDITGRLLGSVPQPSVTRPQTHSSGWGRLSGWATALGGLGAVTALGVWIGIAVPATAIFEFDAATDVGAFDLTTFYSGADWSAVSLDEVGL